MHCRNVAEVYINIHEHKYKDDFVDSIPYEIEKRDRVPRENTSKLEWVIRFPRSHELFSKTYVYLKVMDRSCTLAHSNSGVAAANLTQFTATDVCTPFQADLGGTS